MDPPRDKPPIEVGWMLQNRFTEAEQAAINQARRCLQDTLQQTFDEFDWQLPVIERGEPTPRTIEEPVELIDEGVHQRDARHLDFVFVITAADLRSYTKPFAFATPSRAVGVAVVSISRLTQSAMGQHADDPEVQDRVARRICALALHCLADMLGVTHAGDPQRYSFMPDQAEDLDAMARFDEVEAAKMREELAEVGDPRVEEQEGSRRSRWRFYLRSMVVGRDEIAAAVLRAAPWQFPFRLQRLSTAAMSALLVLMFTEEVWAVSTAQPGWLVGLLSVVVIGVTSGYILKRQNLLLSRSANRLTEQNVVTHTAITVVVIIGMAVTYLLLLGTVLALAGAVFAPTVAEQWAGPMTWREYASLGGFIAIVGVVIGALGASFEGQAYFRHLTYVDEET